MTENIGILSTASIVPRFLSALRENGREACAIASRSLEKAQDASRRWGIPRAYGSYEELLEDPSVGIVYVAMINSEHYRWAKRALEAGRHVIVEKPMTLHADEAEELFRLAQDRHLFVAEALKSVYLPVYQDIREILREGVLGEVCLLEFTSSCAPSYNPWLHSAACGGGALYGNAGYSLSLCRMLAGKIEAYTGMASFGKSEVDEQCVLNLRMESGALAISRITTNLLTENRLVIWGSKGHIVVPDYWKAREAEVCIGKQRRMISHPCRHELQYELQDFLACIEQGKTHSSVMTPQITVGNISIMEELAGMWREEAQRG